MLHVLIFKFFIVSRTYIDSNRTTESEERITIGARLDSNRVQDRAILLEHHTFRNFAGHFAPVAIFNAIIQVLLPNHLIEFDQ